MALEGTVLPPLFECLEKLAFVARHLDPPDLAAVLDAVGEPEAALRALRPSLDVSPDSVDILLARTSDETLAAYDDLRAAADAGDMRAVFRALRYLPRALEVFYPLAAHIPAVSRFFLDPSLRDDSDCLAKIAQSSWNGERGMIHVDNDRGSRGGFSLYIPEYYSPERAWPLVMALHGGSGNGRDFLWTWLRDARSFGAVLAAPTACGNSAGNTWALMGEDNDSPNLARIVAHVREHWNIDPSRLLLTGMSDGGTFCYLAGLTEGSHFTHLAPVSAAFDPMLLAMADSTRLHGLPVYIVHGMLDWMFPVEMARQAGQGLALAGADVTYREIDDLSHTYPREANAGILSWLRGAAPALA